MSNEQETPAAPVEAELLESVPSEPKVAGDDVSADATPANGAAVNEELTETAPETQATGPEPSVAELQKELALAQQKAQENWDKAVRVQAEMENLKRRTQKDLEDAHKYALSNFAKEMLPVLDSLVLGLQAATGDHEQVQKFREGSELTIRQFETVLAKFNIVTLDPVGQPFNAEHHQAMVMQVVEGVEPNTVVTVFQKGYLLNGRLLRPAMVVVAKAAD